MANIEAHGASRVTEEKRRQAFADLLKARRLDMGLSINELARMAGIAKSNLARMEAGEGNPSLETLWALSAALKVNVRDLIEPEPARMHLLRAGQRFDAQAADARFGVSLLSTSPAGAARDIYRVAFEPGKIKLSEPHPQGTIEHVMLVSGLAKIGPVDAPETLAPGDYLSFSGGQRHMYEALKRGTAAIIVMESAYAAAADAPRYAP